MEERVKILFDALRSRIDHIDRNLVHLLEERMHVVTDISDLKARHAIAVKDENRERIVLENIRSAVDDKDFEDYLLQVFEGIMTASRAYQQTRMDAVPRLCRLGLLGATLSHSRSPEIHDAWFHRKSCPGTYELMERQPEDLAELLPALREKGFRGINVTIPYKTHIMRHLDQISPEARRIGAVNTILIDKAFSGYNTDYAGFGRLARSLLPDCTIKKAAVLGTGGSSRAVIAWLEDEGVEELTLVSRDPDEAALKWPGLHTASYEEFLAAGMDLVVNTTPVGMHPHPDASPLTTSQLEGAGSVIDLIYNPTETRLMKDASALGIPTANGLMMLVAQALEAQTIWQGIPYDEKDILAILERLEGRMLE